jgi:drug/metabolite transporter (DMT)-like permease
VARRGNVILLVWVAFLADLFVGAGLLLSKRAALQTAGIAMVLGAALGMAGLTLWYYVQQRRLTRA